MSGWRLRAMTAADVEAVWAGEQAAEVAQGLIHPPPSRAEVAARLALDPADGACLLIEAPAGAAAGYLELRQIEAQGVRCASFELWVAPAWQRQGIARWAVAQVPALAQARWGLGVVLIGVFEDNAAARQLYRAQGYAEVDRQWWWPAEGPRRRVLLLSNQPVERWRRRAGFGSA